MRAKKGVVNPETGHVFASKGRTAVLHQKSVLTEGHSRLQDLRALFMEIERSRQVTFSLKKSLPADILDPLRQLAEKRVAALEAIVEDLDAKSLRQLHSAGLTLFYGIGLPRQAVVILDGKRGFAINETQENPALKLKRIKNAEDLYLALVWHKFGIIVLLSGLVAEVNPRNKLFRMNLNGRRDQWCRLGDSVAKGLPQTGIKLEILGWEKWNTHIIEVLEVKELEPEMGLRD